MGDEDLPLVRALQSGDNSSLDELMGRHKGALFAFIYRYIHNEADATELTQETFVRAYFNINSFTPKAKFIAWLYRIALNLCRDHARSRHYRNAKRTFSLNPGEEDKPVDLPDQSQNPSEIVEQSERMRIVEAAIDRLPHNLRSALILTALGGLSQAEAAERLGTTPKTIETRIHRARKRLEHFLLAE